MATQHPLLYLLTLLAILLPANASAPAPLTNDHVADDGSHGPLSTPNIDHNADANNGTAGTAASSDMMGDQPATVQLGAGFIVGCVLGVIFYVVAKAGTRLVKRRLAHRRERRRAASAEEATEGILVEV